MYLFPLEPLELYPEREGFGMDNKVYSKLKEQGCINPDPTPEAKNTGTGTGTGTDTGSGTETGSGSGTSTTTGTGIGIGSKPEPPLPDKCTKIWMDEGGKTMNQLFDSMEAELIALDNLLRQFDPMPKGWTFPQDLEALKDLLESIQYQYTAMTEFTQDKYVSMTASMKRFDQGVDKLYTDLEKARDTLQSAREEENKEKKEDKEEEFTFELYTGWITDTTQAAEPEIIRVGIKLLEDAMKILEGIRTNLSLFKNEQGVITVDLLSEYDKIYDGTGLAAQKAFADKQKAEAAAVLSASTANSAAAVQSAQDPGFFQSILNTILYSNPADNPNFVYLNKPYENKVLEQARQIVFYVIFAIITFSILKFLSTKTVLMPFFMTFVFWFKRYFVFLAWIFVVALIYSFMTDWLMSMIREDIRYISYTINPVLHPGVHAIWYSKYKQWIKYLVYGFSTLGFFLVAFFLTSILLFLIMPVFLLLLWASGQLMSYFEKEELDE